MNRLPAAVLIAFFSVGPAVYGEERPSPKRPWGAHLRASIEKVRFDGGRPGQTMTSQQSTGRHRTARKVAMAIQFGALGAVMGASIGGSLTEHCLCDDPGYGAIIGFPIGAIAGAITGAWLASR